MIQQLDANPKGVVSRETILGVPEPINLKTAIGHRGTTMAYALTLNHPPGNSNSP